MSRLVLPRGREGGRQAAAFSCQDLEQGSGSALLEPRPGSVTSQIPLPSAMGQADGLGMGPGRGSPDGLLTPLLRHLPQLEGAFPDTMTKCAELLNRTIEVDFVDINVGCPIDLVYKKVVAVQPSIPSGPSVDGVETWDLALLLPESLGTYLGPCASVSPLDQQGMSGPVWVLPFFAPAACLSQGGGCALMNRSAKFQQIVCGMNQVCPKMSPPFLHPSLGPADHTHPHRCWTCR